MQHGAFPSLIGAQAAMPPPPPEDGFVVAEEDSPLFRADDFRIWCMKVIPCTKRYVHDWVQCPFAHAGEKAVRRDPRTHDYTGIACPDMKKQSACIRGDKCPYAHNVFEYWLHPTRYRTQLCNDGPACKRNICFFAHSLEELRVPACKPYVSPETLARTSLEAIHQNPHPLGQQLPNPAMSMRSAPLVQQQGAAPRGGGTPPLGGQPSRQQALFGQHLGQRQQQVGMAGYSMQPGRGPPAGSLTQDQQQQVSMAGYGMQPGRGPPAGSLTQDQQQQVGMAGYGMQPGRCPPAGSLTQDQQQQVGMAGYGMQPGRGPVAGSLTQDQQQQAQPPTHLYAPGPRTSSDYGRRSSLDGVTLSLTPSTPLWGGDAGFTASHTPLAFNNCGSAHSTSAGMSAPPSCRPSYDAAGFGPPSSCRPSVDASAFGALSSCRPSVDASVFGAPSSCRPSIDASAFGAPSSCRPSIDASAFGAPAAYRQSSSVPMATAASPHAFGVVGPSPLGSVHLSSGMVHGGSSGSLAGGAGGMGMGRGGSSGSLASVDLPAGKTPYDRDPGTHRAETSAGEAASANGLRASMEQDLAQSLATLKIALTQQHVAAASGSNHEIVISTLHQILKDAVAQQGAGAGGGNAPSPVLGGQLEMPLASSPSAPARLAATSSFFSSSGLGMPAAAAAAPTLSPISALSSPQMAGSFAATTPFPGSSQQEAWAGPVGPIKPGSPNAASPNSTAAGECRLSAGSAHSHE